MDTFENKTNKWLYIFKQILTIFIAYFDHFQSNESRTSFYDY